MNNIDLKLNKICISCLVDKPIVKYQKYTRVCISCRNIKYYKKSYFKDYYETHSEEILKTSAERYMTVNKINHPLKRGRPKKEKPLEILV